MLLVYLISEHKRPTLLTLLHSEWPKLHRVLAILSAIVLNGGGQRGERDTKNTVCEIIYIHSS